MVQVIVLDTETTGISAHEDRVVELAGIELHANSGFSRLCNPGRGIPPEAMAVHHITEDDVKHEPTTAQVHEMFVSHFGVTDDTILVAHNAKFDKGFVSPLISPLKPKWLCTMKSAREVFPNAPGYSNQVLRYWLGLKPDVPAGLAPHRALYDILCTREILRVLLQHRDLADLVELSNRPQLLKKVGFGKYKGKLWSEVDRGMLNWILNQDFDEDIKHTVNFYLGRMRS